MKCPPERRQPQGGLRRENSPLEKSEPFLRARPKKGENSPRVGGPKHPQKYPKRVRSKENAQGEGAKMRQPRKGAPRTPPEKLRCTEKGGVLGKNYIAQKIVAHNRV